MSSIIGHLLPSPRDLELLYPLSAENHLFIQASRQTASQILKGLDGRLAILVGPCSIHDPNQALEYGSRLKALQKRLQGQFFLIMRVFLEKPRTRLGWKGMLYDPYLDGSSDLQEGLIQGRKLLRELNDLGVPCATEFLEPLTALYLSDLITWGLIGARTAASPTHRQLASGLPFPVGFKNSVHGELETALSGIVTARTPHTHFSIDPNGRLASVQTTGNPLSHLVLRGSDLKPNCDPESVQNALHHLREYHLEERVLIDCAHGNSGKDLQRQLAAFQISLKQILAGNQAIRGMMLESHLVSGKQPLGDEPDLLTYGVSITDPCLGWKETEELLLEAAPLISMSSVQK